MRCETGQDAWWEESNLGCIDVLHPRPSLVTTFSQVVVTVTVNIMMLVFIGGILQPTKWNTVTCISKWCFRARP
jgi:hypothetical protein